jgi:hypothetical protein
MFAWGDLSTALFAAPTRDLDKTLVVDDSPFTDPSALKPTFLYCLGPLCSRCRWPQARGCWKRIPKLRHPNVSCMQFPASHDDSAAHVS